jgi:hypothetical protein
MSDTTLEPPASYVKAHNNYYLRHLRWKLAVCATASQKSEEWLQLVNELFIEPIKKGKGASQMRRLSGVLSDGPLSLASPAKEIPARNPEDSFFEAYEILLLNPMVVGKLPNRKDIKALALRLWARDNLIEKGVLIGNVFNPNKQEEAALNQEVTKLKSKVPWRIWETMGLRKKNSKTSQKVAEKCE